MRTLTTQIIAALMILLLGVGCMQSEGQPRSIITPTHLTISQSPGTGTIRLSWEDKNDKVDGFTVSYKEVGAEEYTTLASLGAEERSYDVEKNLEPGRSYYFAVSSMLGGETSKPATKIYRVLRNEEVKGVSILQTLASHAGVAVEYKPVNLYESEKKSLGLQVFISSDGIQEPLLEVPAPTDWRGKESCLQMIPITRLPKDQAKIYVRAYARGDQSSTYSPLTEFTLPEQPGAIKLDWSEITPESLKGKVEIYKTSSELNGRPFQAWYAVGNPEKSRIKRNDPASNTPLAQQASQLSKALVLVNGSYFYMNTTLGLYGHDGLKGQNEPLRGSLHQDHEEYAVKYHATRGFFGVTKEGDARISWGSTESANPHLYEHPLPVLLGEASYQGFSEEIVGAPLDWTPYYGLSGGPVVLKDGRVPVDFAQFRDGQEFYLGNFELIPYDIFGKNVRPDRTAVGIREDGRIVLLVCDGRIPESQGADLIELAQVMKGLGCKDALNLDGGGSTNMWVNGDIINHKDIVKGTNDTRAIKSIIGFFEK